MQDIPICEHGYVSIKDCIDCLNQILKETQDTMEWYSKETTGFCRVTEGGKYTPVSLKATMWLEKYRHLRNERKEC